MSIRLSSVWGTAVYPAAKPLHPGNCGAAVLVTLILSLFAALMPVVAYGGDAVPGIVAPAGTHNGEDVEQPIAFPHDVHADIDEINCMYCHTYARRSNVAGIPPLSKCLGCHSVIATDKPRIKKLTEYWDNRRPPPWKKVHDLPDYVHFSHQKHLKRLLFDNKELAVEQASEVCALCHGDVKKMTVAKKVKPLNMGFCVRCHEANDGPFDCWKCHK